LNWICFFGLIFFLDAALFNWSQDLKQLKEGPFQFKFREFPQKNFKAIILTAWRDYFN